MRGGIEKVIEGECVGKRKGYRENSSERKREFDLISISSGYLTSVLLPSVWLLSDCIRIARAIEETPLGKKSPIQNHKKP